MSVDIIHVQLDWMNKKDEQHIRITSVVGLSVEFLEIHVENSNGALMTSVFHKPAAEPYVLLNYVRIRMYLTGNDETNYGAKRS